MAIVGTDDGSIQADSQPRFVGLVWVSAAAWHSFRFIGSAAWWCEVLPWFCHDGSTINIVINITTTPTITTTTTTTTWQWTDYANFI